MTSISEVGDRGSSDEWAHYLHGYHATRPGITEQVLSAASHPQVGSPYAWLRAGVPACPGDVVDLACGSAPMFSLLGRATGYVGLDRSEGELGVAAARGRESLLRADALSLPLASGSVDTVLCSMAVMLLQPIEAALAEVSRVLRPGGVFATIRPAGSPFRLGDLRLVVPLLAGLRHLPELPQRFTGRRLKGLLADAGMTLTDDSSVRFVHPLEDEADARLAVQSLYLPHVNTARQQDAIRRLQRRARPGAELPLAIRRTVAVRR